MCDESSQMKHKIILILTFLTLFTFSGKAWIYPEHRDITLLAILKLDSVRRVTLDHLWMKARAGHESRLHETIIDIHQGILPEYIDYAAWPAIAGDHSTSACDMVNNILQTTWILKVADVTARLKIGLAESDSKSEKEQQLRASDLRLLRVDPEYVSRAGSNNVHFMLSRSSETISADDYFSSSFAEGADINLIGTYIWYHTSALLKAKRLASSGLTPEQYSVLSLSMLADEAFALHFLEDAFSAGHVAGIWGNAALRKGTHDYYDENGLEVTTWQGGRLVLTGDAFMRQCDAERSAETVKLSFEQLIDAVNGKIAGFNFNDQPDVMTPDTLNIAATMMMPPRIIDPFLRELYSDVLITTPVPGLNSGLGEIPRFRAELGPFIGIAPAGSFSVISGGFAMNQQTIGVIPDLEVALHIGLGLDGVLNESGDGLVFLDLGWRLNSASSIKIEHDPDLKYFGSILSAIPSREGFYARIRLPFFLIPGDLLVAGPLLYLTAPNSFNKFVATAGQGGLIPWQTGMITPLGRFQFVLGREVGICFYGTVQGADAFLLPIETGEDGGWALCSLRSTQLDFPILEYRPVRTFSKRQSASLLMQLNVRVDIPGKVTMLEPVMEEPISLKPIWSVGLRLAFDWRYYYGSKKTSRGEAH